MVYRGRQLHNDAKDLESIADSYENKLQYLGPGWLSSALQKDAIQNSWDARKPQNGEWSVDFQLIETAQGKFLVITDQGTTGLLGNLWESEEEQIKLLNKEQSDENLAFFLSSNFSNKTSTSGGKRGRGKSLFLVASDDKAFFFESLRADGLRVFGGQYIESVSKSIEVELTQEDTFLNDNIGGRHILLKKPGTKIYIKSPQKIVVDEIYDGSFLSHIEKTWWEIIKKYKAAITITTSNGKKTVSVPDYYQDDLISSKSDLRVKEYPNLQFNVNGDKFRVKRIKLIYDPSGGTPDDIRGIAIQRNGMTIERRPAEQLVKEEGMQKVYGWVEMEHELEEAMYDLEDVEHLSFNWVKNPASKLRTEIMMKARDFAREVKIIESELSKEHDIHKKVEDNVADRINKYLSSLGFTGFSRGRGPIKSHARDKDLPLKISAAHFKTSTFEKRVNYEDHIVAVAQAISIMDQPILIRIKVWLVSKSGRTTRSLEKDITLNPQETFEIGWDKIVITKDEFPRDDYSFRAKIIVMEDTNIDLPRIGRLEKGNDLIRTSASFSVEQDPKQSGFLKFFGTPRDIYLECYPEDNEIIVEYGTEHPYISQFMEPDKKPELEKFLMQNGIILALNEVLSMDLASDSPKIFKDINSGSFEPHEILPTIMHYASKFLSE